MMNRLIVLILIAVASLCAVATDQVPFLQAAEPESDSLIDAYKPTVETEISGLFVAAPTLPNFVVMNFRLFDDGGSLVFETRSEGEPIAIMSADLADGYYRYEAVTVFQIGEGTKGRAANAKHGVSRNFGRFFISGGTLSQDFEVGMLGHGHDSESANSDSVLSRAAMYLAHTLAWIVPDAAADVFTQVEVESTDPFVLLDDTDNPESWEWGIAGYSNVAGDYGWFRIFDVLGANSQSVLALLSNGDGTNSNSDSFVSWTNGNVSLANGLFWFEKEQPTLSIGGSVFTGSELNILGSDPSMSLFSEVYTDWMGVEYDGLYFNTYWDGGLGPTNITRVVWAAPENSLVIDGTGYVGLGLDAPTRQLHLRGPNAAFRMDRSENTAAFLIVRTMPDGTPMKSYVVGTNAAGVNNGEFIINDLGNATGGAGSRRMTITNTGTVVFTGTVQAAGFAQVSSRELKDNVQQIDEPLALTQQLRGVRFDWKDSGQPAIGFIAEDIEAVLPEVVAHDETSGKVSAVNYGAVVPVLVEAIKEQQEQIAQQQTEIATLKEQISEFQNLKARLAAVESQVAAGQSERILVHN